MDFVYRHFKPWSRYSNRYAQRRGRKDGAKNIPPPDAEEFADYEMELKNLADENIRRIGAAWAREDRILKKDYCQSLSEFEVSKRMPRRQELRMNKSLANTAKPRKKWESITGRFNCPPLSTRLSWRSLAWERFR